jgi:mannitol/fructose-specific phosphotransferase system IIA component (Ntr-type)
MAFAAILAFISTANAGILAASRFPMAMSRDHLLPEYFAKISKRSNTPYFSIIFTGILMVIVILLLNLENLVKVASAMQIVLFLFVFLACIIMRESRILNYRPTFASPLYPWLHIAGIICYCFLLYQMGSIALLTTGGFFLTSILWHRFYARGKAIRRSALVNIVARVVAKDIAGPSLDTELREILKERDNIVEDRFDKLVEECEIVDISERITYLEFFAIAAKKLAEPLGVNEKQLLDSFIARERDSTTEIRPGLAIPHITVDGEGKFEVLIARCEAGIDFSESLPPVYAAFVLVGSLDGRDFHLRALSAIAQVTQDADFDRDWLRAKSIDELRDIILLAKRRREEIR